MGPNPAGRFTKQPPTPGARESGPANDGFSSARKGQSPRQPRPFQLGRPDEVDRRDETDGKIENVEASRHASGGASRVEEDLVTQQKGHADEAGHTLGASSTNESSHEILEVEASKVVSEITATVEDDPERKQIEAAGIARRELTIRRVGATRTVLGTTSLIVNSNPGL